MDEGGLYSLFMHWLLCWEISPIFAEIVPERARTSIYALDRGFESLLASFAPPVVGILAERVYGYIPPKAGTDATSELLIDKDNAVSLSKALYTAIGAPLTLCCLIYTLLYWTYPRDRDHARALSSQLGASYEFEKFGLEDENELDVIDVYGEDEIDDDDDSDNNTETEWMFNHKKSDEVL